MDLETIFRWPITPRRWQALKAYLVSQRLIPGRNVRLGPSSVGVVVAARRAPRVVGGGGGCPNWHLDIGVDGADKMQLKIGAPGTIAGIMPEFSSVPLDDDPAPLVTVPDTADDYLVYFALEWVPDVGQLGDDYFAGDTGTLTEVRIIVAVVGTPPTDVEPTVNTSTGAVTANAVEHRRFARVTRGAGGELTITQNDLCRAMEAAICGGVVRLAPMS